MIGSTLWVTVALGFNPSVGIAEEDTAAPRVVESVPMDDRWDRALSEEAENLLACGAGRLTVELVGKAGALVGVEVIEPGGRDASCVVSLLERVRWPPFPADGHLRAQWGEPLSSPVVAQQVEVSDCLVAALRANARGEITLRWRPGRPVEVVEDAAYHPPLRACLLSAVEDWPPVDAPVDRTFGVPRVEDDVLHATLKERRPELNACASRASMQLNGRLDLAVKVVEGEPVLLRVVGVDSEDHDVVSCYLETLAGWSFPERDGWLTYSFVLEPSGIQRYDPSNDRDYAFYEKPGLSVADIERAVTSLLEERHGWFDACYEEHQMRRSGLAGRWSLSCEVQTTGQLRDCTVDPMLMEDPPFEACLVEKAEKMTVDGKIDQPHQVNRLLSFSVERIGG